MAVFVIRGIDNDGLPARDTVARCALRVIEGKRKNRRAADFEDGVVFHLMKTPAGGYLGEIDRNIGLGHLAFEGFLKTAGAPAMKGDVVVRAIDRPEEGKALNVIPVKVGQKD